MGAIAGGAEAVLLPEHPFNLGQLHQVAEHLLKGFRQRRRHGIVICEENAAQEMRPIQVNDAIATAGRGFFETRFVQLGHVQRGGIPTAFDRELGSRMGSAAVEEFLNGQAKASMVTLVPSADAKHYETEMDHEGWTIQSKQLADLLKPSKLYKGECETNKDWWIEDEFPDLQRVLTGPPYYDEGLVSRPDERYHRPLAF